MSLAVAWKRGSWRRVVDAPWVPLAFATDSKLPEMGGSLLRVLALMITSFHSYIVSLSVLGMIFARTRLRILLCVGTALVLVSSYFHPIFYVTMNAYPFVYISAGLALAQGPRRLADFIARIGSGWFPQCGERITSVSRTLAYMSMVILVLLAVWSTNTDLYGDYRFAQQWLGGSRW